jgi:hypothetical protein
MRLELSIQFTTSHPAIFEEKIKPVPVIFPTQFAPAGSES